jgi:hypothetical protein
MPLDRQRQTDDVQSAPTAARAEPVPGRLTLTDGLTGPALPPTAETIARRLYDALGGYHANSGSAIATLRELLAENATWTVPGQNLLAGVYNGVDGIAAYLAKLERITGDLPGEPVSGLAAEGHFHPAFRSMTLDGRVATVEAAASATRTPGGTQFGGQRVSLDGVTLGLYQLIVTFDDHGKIASLVTVPDNITLFNGYWSGGTPQ